ncbi:MAG TPA: hypothetical protein VH591_14590 [Ktedonobacterales bacterium]
MRRGKQIHGGDGPLREDGEGLQLPTYGFSPIPGVPRISYPKGWTFNWLTPARTSLLVGGGFFALIVLCIALAKLLAG